MQDELARGRIVVVAGYQGVSYKREVTTLGRGGSDTTAVAMAAALDAEYCEICSDVDGVYSADPTVDREAERHEGLTYMDFISQGLRVMDATAVTMCKEHGVPIVVFDMTVPGNIVRAVAGEQIGTIVH